jgi:hypothetical protein
MARPVTPDHPLAPREDGYSPIASYAAIGDGRTVALVALDGSVDWLCLPDLDSPAVFAALLDSESGGSFTLRPEAPFGSVRRYLPGTNVLETTFETTTGTVRVTDALTIPAEGLSPQRELVRVIETVAGRVPMRWEVTPRFGFGSGRVLLGRRGGVPVASCGSDALAVCSWGAGEAAPSAGGIRGRFEANPADRVVIALSAAHQEPLIMPAKPDVEARLTHTIGMWRGWAEALRVGSAWREAVKRSALALKLLVYAPSGAPPARRQRPRGRMAPRARSCCPYSRRSSRWAWVACWQSRRAETSSWRRRGRSRRRRRRSGRPRPAPAYGGVVSLYPATCTRSSEPFARKRVWRGLHRVGALVGQLCWWRRGQMGLDAFARRARLRKCTLER